MTFDLCRQAGRSICLTTALFFLTSTASPAEPDFWRVVLVNADSLDCLHGQEAITVLACKDRCVEIPWQLDERDGSGRWIIDEGPEASMDDPPGVVDENDALLWMVSDSGRKMSALERTAISSRCLFEAELRFEDRSSYAYIVRTRAPVPPDRKSYVHYDPLRDVINGARMALGFGAGTPRYLAIRDTQGTEGGNMLDRLKVRAQARFLGLIPVGRDEDHLETTFAGWHRGPIRVIRRQRQRVYLGFGIRTPDFVTDSFVYRDYAEIPVTFRLNFKATHFFWPISVRAVLDFRDLYGWAVHVAGIGSAWRVGAAPSDLRERLGNRGSRSFELYGTNVTIVNVLSTSDSLRTLAVNVAYEENKEWRRPESVRGESPAIGYVLTRWDDVPSGWHTFTSTSYVLPGDYPPEVFQRELAARLQVIVRRMP